MSPGDLRMRRLFRLALQREREAAQTYVDAPLRGDHAERAWAAFDAALVRLRLIWNVADMLGVPVDDLARPSAGWYAR